MRTWILLASLAVVTACTSPPPQPDVVRERIAAEMAQASSQRKSHEKAESALLAPLTVEMPRQDAAGSGDARFDLSIVNAPAAQVFMAIVTGTRYNMLVGPEVTGNITVNLKDVTVRDALESIRELYGYEYSIKGNRILIQPNTLQTRVFHVSYLAGRRVGESQVRVTSSSISSVGGTSTPNTGAPVPQGTGSSGGAANPQASQVVMSMDNNFLTELEKELQTIVPNEGGRSIRLNKTSGVVLVRAFPNELRSVEQYLKATKLMVERQVMLEAKILEVSLRKEFHNGINWASFKGNTTFGVAQPGTSIRPTDTLPRGPGSDYGLITGPAGNVRGLLGNVISNPISGSGGPLGTGATGADVAAGALGTVVASALGKGFIGLAFQTASFAAMLNFLETQGTLSVLSSPRIATLNNQKAVLKVGTDELFVTNVSSNVTSTASGSTSTPNVTLQPYFSGISLDVTPQIDDDGNIILHVHPAISRVEEKRKFIDLGALGSYTLPLASVTVRETDSIVRVQDGNIVAIGGLMSEGHTSDGTGLPGSLNSTLGALAGQRGSMTEKRELVILLKPTIIEDDRSWTRDLEQSAERLRNIDLPPVTVPLQ